MTRRFKINLETSLDNKQLHCRRTDVTIKELQEELGNLAQTHIVYTIYTTPISKVLLIFQKNWS